MSLGLANYNATPQTNTLSLGAASNGFGAPSPYGAPQQYNTAYGGASPFTTGILGGAGVSQQQYGAPITPPSETEILAAMLGTIQPIDRFIISQNMPVFVEMLSNITTFSLLNVLKNCTFTVDDEGTMALEITSLPSDLQTLSAENIIAQLNSLQSTSMQIIQQAEQERQQILMMADQSMMQGMLGAAMTDPGMMENAGQAVGGMFNRAIFGRP
jgi:hypothetical protein